jgi:hypothetical protein
MAWHRGAPLAVYGCSCRDGVASIKAASRCMIDIPTACGSCLEAAGVNAVQGIGITVPLAVYGSSC